MIDGRFVRFVYDSIYRERKAIGIVFELESGARRIVVSTDIASVQERD